MEDNFHATYGFSHAGGIAQIAFDNLNIESFYVFAFAGREVIKDANFPPSLQSWMQGFDEIYSDKWIDKLSPRPILIIHGDQDDVVSPTSAFNLYKRAGEPKEILIVKGAGHRLRISDEAMRHAISWLKSHSFRD